MEFKEQILELKNSICYEDFYKEFLPELQGRGKLMWTPCPFHSESKPSFSVDITTGLWRCWGEQISGDVFSFYQKMFGVSFREAVEEIAEKIGFELVVDEEEQNRRKHLSRLYKTIDNICGLYEKNLLGTNTEAGSALDYLRVNREMSDLVVRKFRLGKGVNFSKRLSSYFEAHPEAKERLAELELYKDSKSRYGENRITIPYIDDKGRVIGFNGRVYFGDDSHKYMFPSDTPIFKKSENIFGIWQAKDSINKLGSAILVEGEIDCIRCHQYGISNTVALGGLNISDSQINLLKKHGAKTFYWVLEDDAPLRVDTDGNTTLYKLYKKFQEHIPYVRFNVIDLRHNGEKCDADNFFSSHSKQDFQKLIQCAPCYNQFLIDDKLKSMTPKDIQSQNACLGALVPLLKEIENYSERVQYITLVSNRLGIAENLIYKKVKGYQFDTNHTIVTDFDSRPVYAQKILLSSIFATNFNTLNTLMEVKYKAYDYMEKFYQHLIDITWDYAYEKGASQGFSFKGMFDELYQRVQDGDFDKTSLKILTDCYLKSEQLDEFEEDDMSTLVGEQIETLTQWALPTC